MSWRALVCWVWVALASGPVPASAGAWTREPGGFFASVAYQRISAESFYGPDFSKIPIRPYTQQSVSAYAELGVVQRWLTLMFDGGSTVEGAALNGCWGSCHMDLRTMPDASDAAKGHAKAKALGWNEGVTKYLAESRTAVSASKPRGGWDKLRSDADIAAALKAGKFLDLIQFRSGKGEKPADGHVLDARHMSGGKSLVKAEGKKEGNKWVVVFERTLAASGPGDHAIAADKTYNFGFAIHEDHADDRHHHVSLGYQFGLDRADPAVKSYINVVKQ